MVRRIFSEHVGLDNPCVLIPDLEIPNKELSDHDRVIDMIFVADHKTGLPSSDISVYLSAKTPIQVRDFIKQNIFGDPKEHVNGWSEDIDDDLIADLVRQNDETVEDYSSRISNFMVSEREKVHESFARMRNLNRTKESKSD